MGDLNDFDLAAILRVLAERRATGVLRIVADADEVSLYLRQGRPVMLTSARLPLRLGRMLLHRGLVDGPRLHEALREQEAEGYVRSLGAVLLARGWITAADLGRCLDVQCVVALARALAAERGAFAYTPDVDPPPEVASVPLDADRVLAEAARRVEDVAALRGHLPSRHLPLPLGAGAETTPLTGTEARVAAALRLGEASIAELTDLLPIDEPTLLLNLIGMHERGLVVPFADALELERGPDRAAGGSAPPALVVLPPRVAPPAVAGGSGQSA